MNDWEWNLLETKTTLSRVEINGSIVKPGDRVRLHPKEGGDILDLALRGQFAMVESIEEDYEGAQHLSVVLEEDPGRDLGFMRHPGHRFFFTPSEVELIAATCGGTVTPAEETDTKPRVLIAGIGNIFLGDDGFGVEVARRMMAGPHRGSVRVVDFGIRGFDLVYALQDGFDTTILVDAYPHGQKPGTVTVIEPDVAEPDESVEFVQPHAMNPLNVLRMVRAMNGSERRVLLVGCEPLDVGGDEGRMGLSPVVEAAVDEAVAKIKTLVEQILN
jgi:hydrogenase maturation protease